MSPTTYNVVNDYMGSVAAGAAAEAKLEMVTNYVEARMNESYQGRDIEALSKMLGIVKERSWEK